MLAFRSQLLQVFCQLVEVACGKEFCFPTHDMEVLFHSISYRLPHVFTYKMKMELRGGISRDMNQLSADLQLELMRWGTNNPMDGSSYTNYVPLCIIDDLPSIEIHLPVSWLRL